MNRNNLMQAPSIRALLVGALGSLTIGVGIPYDYMVLQGSRLGSFFNTPAAIVLLFIVVVFLNTGLGLIRRSWMFTQAELALIYIMWLVATAIPSWGLTGFLLPDITSAIYYATPDNNWNALLIPFIPDWIIPHHDLPSIKNFYEGAPQGTGIPWALWIGPLAYWIPFVLALYLAMICIMVILRRQWVENEQLSFPIVQVPLAMIQDGEGRSSLIKPFFKSRLMWLGFLIPAVIQSINGFHHYYPYIPQIQLGTTITLFRTFGIPLHFSFQMLGFSYFIRPNIALSLWVFYLLNSTQQAILSVLGVQPFDPLLGVYSAYASTIIVHQGFGAIVVFVLVGLWMGRKHLRLVLRKGILGDACIDDSDEILSYRAAVFCLISSLSFMGFWIWQSGLPAWITPIYLLLAFIVFLGLTRAVAEGGLVFVFAPMVASDFVAAGFGTRALGSSGIISLAFTYVWASDILTFVMASCANGLKLVQQTILTNRRLVFWAMLLAILLSLGSSIWAVLELAYRYGGVNTDQHFFGQAAQYPFTNATARMLTIEGPHWENWGFTAIGAVIMGLLMAANQRLYWWPLHPLGFPFSGVFGGMFFSVFLAWMLKTTLVHYGGAAVYKKTRPFFLGLILGQFVTAAVWLGVDYLAGSSGNRVMDW